MQAASHSRARGTELIVLLLAINILNMLDRNLLGILAAAIKDDLGISDTQIGLLGGLFFSAVYAVGGLPLGKLADKGFARHTVAGAVAVWSAMTALGGFAQNFWHLAIARLGVAGGEAAAAPAAHSIIAKHFPENRRATMISLYSIGTPIGFMIGLAMGGWLVETSGWRTAFIAIGLPGLILALIAWWRLPRTGPAEQLGDEVQLLKTVRYLWSKPSFRHTMIGASLYSFVGYSLNTFLALSVMNSHGVGAAQAGLWLGLITGISGLLGMPLSGWLADRLAVREPGWRLKISALLMGLSAPFLGAALMVESWLLAMALLFVPHMLTYAYLGPTFAAMHTIVPQHMRAMTTSCLLAALTLFGASLGPPVIGAISDALTGEYGRHSLSVALMLLPIVLLLSSWQFAVGARKLKGDTYRAPGEVSGEAPRDSGAETA